MELLLVLRFAKVSRGIVGVQVCVSLPLVEGEYTGLLDLYRHSGWCVCVYTVSLNDM